MYGLVGKAHHHALQKHAREGARSLTTNKQQCILRSSKAKFRNHSNRPHFRFQFSIPNVLKDGVRSKRSARTEVGKCLLAYKLLIAEGSLDLLRYRKRYRPTPVTGWNACVRVIDHPFHVSFLVHFMASVVYWTGGRSLASGRTVSCVP